MRDLSGHDGAGLTKVAKTPKQAGLDTQLTIKDSNVDNTSMGEASGAKYRE